MSPVAATQMPASGLHVDWKPVRDTLAALRAGHESLDLFVGQLFSGFETMRERLDQHDRRIKEERRQLALERERLTAERAKLQGQIQASASESPRGETSADFDQERAALEEELESVRQRCEELSGTVAEQKRQLAEERAEWTAEFRQLRKILDKQSQILALERGTPRSSALGGRARRGCRMRRAKRRRRPRTCRSGARFGDESVSVAAERRCTAPRAACEEQGVVAAQWGRLVNSIELLVAR